MLVRLYLGDQRHPVIVLCEGIASNLCLFSDCFVVYLELFVDFTLYQLDFSCSIGIV